MPRFRCQIVASASARIQCQLTDDSSSYLRIVGRSSSSKRLARPTCYVLRARMHFKYRKGSPGNGRKKRIIKLTRWGIRNKWGATYGDPSGIITVTDGGSGVDRKIGSGRPFHPFSDDQFAPEGCCDGVPVLGGGEARCASRLCCVATTADRRARVY